MHDARIQGLVAVLRQHEREVAKLLRGPAHEGPADFYVAAQLTRHRISIALLESQIDSGAVRPH